MEDTRKRCGTAVVVSGFIGILIATSFLLGCERYTAQKAREDVLRQDLFAMRAVLDQYIVDRHQRPQSLNDLVTAGYLKEVPKDPMTGRSDTWVVHWSKDPKMLGIDRIDSGSRLKSRTGAAYSTW